MKKSILILLITALAVQTFAQTSGNDQKLHFGLKAAPSLAWLKTDSQNPTSEGTKFGFSYGLITEFKIAPNYAFATGLDITYRGGNLKAFSDSAGTKKNISYNYNLQYIELPLTLKLKTNEIGSFTYFLQIGVAPGINIRARADVQTTTQPVIGSSTTTDESDVDIKDKINDINTAMIIAAGLEYSLSGSTVLLTSIMFNNGFVDVLDGDPQEANSNYLALTIGVLF